MNTCEILESEIAAECQEQVLHLPLGLLGFEAIKKYVLLSDAADAPFHWLQVEDDPHLAFLVLSPFEVMPDYEMDLSEEDAVFLGLDSAKDALVYNIVTLGAGGTGTINLKGPIVLNRYTWIGKQVVLTNASRYSLQHPLPASE